MSQQVDCMCGHDVEAHRIFICAVCNCKKYDPAGHNPDLINIVCPACHMVRMEREQQFGIYFCVACNYVIPEDRINGETL